MVKKIWTLEYRPFVMGGNVYQPVACEVEAGDEVDLGGGYKGHEIVSPNGKIVVVESTSGAIVGNSVTDVREDIRTADPAVMKKQVEEALIDVQRARVTTPEEFWRLYKG